MIERPVFVSQFAAFGNGDFVKLDAFDLEPVFAGPDRVETHPGVPVRLVMTRSSATALRDMLTKHLENPQMMTETARPGLSSYAAKLKAEAERYMGKEKDTVSENAGILMKYSVYPRELFRPVADSVLASLSLFAPTKSCPNPGDLVFPAGNDHEARELYGALVCYVSHCNPRSKRDIGALRAILDAVRG